MPYFAFVDTNAVLARKIDRKKNAIFLLKQPFRIRRESVAKPIIVWILPFAKSFEKCWIFLYQNPSRSFWMKHRTSSAVSSKYFDTFIYTFIAIYKSLKIIHNTVLFSLLPYSVPFNFYAKTAFSIL